MTPLKNPRHEKFAQAMAVGNVTAGSAYRKLYPQSTNYEKDGPRLHGKAEVRRRIAELQSASATETTLTIAEKREFIARLVRAKLRDLPADSDLWQELTTTAEGGMKFKMPDKLRAIALDNDLAGEGSEANKEGVVVVVRIGGQDDANG